MKRPFSICAALLGSTVLFQFSSAEAATVTWTDSDSGETQITWSSAEADDLKKILADRKVSITEDGSSDKLTGPGGGVLLRSFNDIYIELDADSGMVEAVRKTKDGEIARRTLFDAFAAGSEVFKKNGTTQVMVTVSAAQAASAESLLDSKATTRRTQLLFDIVIFDVNDDGSTSLVDQVALAYDASSLQPAVAWKKVRDYTGNYWTGTSNWYGLNNGGYWWTPPSYWDAAVTK